jgi:TolB-like protein
VIDASIAVLPFRLIGDAGQWAAIADALPHELIAELSRLRWLFVTARGSSFRLRSADADMGEIGRLLGVRYCLSGTVEVANSKLAVTVELVDTRSGGVVWADHFAGGLDAVHPIRTEIRARILAALEIQIPLHEANLARLTVTENLDAWSAYHLGLQHMYRFNHRDNAVASELFQRAVTQDPGFARAHAGLSFVHFQAGFMRQTDDIAGEIIQARSFAQRGLDLDPLDPFVNFAMGRSFWLEGDLDRGGNTYHHGVFTHTVDHDGHQ